MAINWKDIRKTLGPEREARIKDRVREEVARQEHEDREPEYDDEPRLPGKSSLDLFNEACKAADAEKQREKDIQSGVDSAVVEPTVTGFSAYTPKFPGCISIGRTREATLANLREALGLHLDGMAEEAAREAGRRLIALGGTMPGIKDVPRRKGEAADAAKQREKESNDHGKKL